jgi:hypothetical protein
VVAVARTSPTTALLAVCAHHGEMVAVALDGTDGLVEAEVVAGRDGNHVVHDGRVIEVLAVRDLLAEVGS